MKEVSQSLRLEKISLFSWVTANYVSVRMYMLHMLGQGLLIKIKEVPG